MRVRRRLLSAGTAALRGSRLARDLGRVCARIGAGRLRILSPGEEAALAFLGATACEPGELPDPVAVVDVGGGSTEVAVGTPGEPPAWWASRPVGSRRLTDRALRSDPPSRDQLAAARNAAARRFVGVEPPAAELALAVGGGTTSLRRISGGRLDRRTIGELQERLCSAPSEDLARGARPRPAAGSAPARGAGGARGGLRAPARAAADRPRRSEGRPGAGALAGSRRASGGALERGDRSPPGSRGTCPEAAGRGRRREPGARPDPRQPQARVLPRVGQLRRRGAGLVVHGPGAVGAAGDVRPLLGARADRAQHRPAAAAAADPGRGRAGDGQRPRDERARRRGRRRRRRPAARRRNVDPPCRSRGLQPLPGQGGPRQAVGRAPTGSRGAS